MSSTVIRVENLSKKYVIKHANGRAPRQGLRHAIQDTVTAPFRRLSRRFQSSTSDFLPSPSPPASEDFFALKDVSFEVKQGEVIGIIGRNGAGKSTLLKILSRITEPTSGRIGIKGRVASLLEVGTGFHPELTGRENIFLNGAILGMTRAEVRTKFDAIVDFAGVEKFLQTPVKHYSSGMYVRLAFAVAAHLDPEILIVDEVLAVGDAEFQRKCLGKIQNISEQQGRTVLFVSHQMGTVGQLCTKGILLSQGSITFNGLAKRAVEAYMEQARPDTSGRFNPDVISLKEIVIARAETQNANGEPANRFTHNEPISVVITCRINQWVTGAEVRLIAKDSALRTVFTTDTAIERSALGSAETIDAIATIPASFLRPGTFIFTLATIIPDVLIIDLIHDAFSITVIDGGSKYAASEGMDYGCVFAQCEWRLRNNIDRTDRLNVPAAVEP